MTRNPRLTCVGLVFLGCLLVGPAHGASIGDAGNLIVSIGSGGVVEFDGASGGFRGTFL